MVRAIAIMAMVGMTLSAKALVAQAPQHPASNGTHLEYIGTPVRAIPVSSAVKAGKFVFVSGTPGFDKAGKLAVGDFAAQAKQVMDNITGTLKAAGTGWDRVVKVSVMLTRSADFGEMNRIYSTYFANGNFPARTTMIVTALPQPDFLLEIECEAVLE
jgi:2-iminobutanoate/2-iminopropanoate deaminase